MTVGASFFLKERLTLPLVVGALLITVGVMLGGGGAKARRQAVVSSGQIVSKVRPLIRAAASRSNSGNPG